MDYQSLHLKTVVELRKLAKDAGVKIPTGTNKNTLIEMLLEAERAAAPKSAEKPAAPKPAKAERNADKAPEAKAEKAPEAKAEKAPEAKAEKADAAQAEKPRRGRKPAAKASAQAAPESAKKAEAPKAVEPPKPAAAKPVEAVKPEPAKPAAPKPVEAPKPEPAKPAAPKPMEAAKPEPTKPAQQPEAQKPAEERAAARPAMRGGVVAQPRPAIRTAGEDRQRPVQGRGYQNWNGNRQAQGDARTPRFVQGNPQGAQQRPGYRFNNRPDQQPPRPPRPAEPAATAAAPQQPATSAPEGERPQRQEGYYSAEYKTSNPAVPEMLAAGECGDGAGVLEIQPDGYGFLRAENCLPGPNDVYISIAQIRRFNLRNGDHVVGKTRAQREGDRFGAMLYITEVNGETPEKAAERPRFEDLVPIYPNERLRLEPPEGRGDISLRLIDMLAPIGKGQRGMIVSQPKAGKTTLLKKVANAITSQYPDVHLIVLLIDERPEEVTDMQRSIKGEVIYSTFDEEPEHHTRVSEMVLSRAQRLVEMGKDVVVLMDSITRLARAYNLTITPTGRSLSGGLDPGALFRPKRFFGAARNIENGGSLTIIATALVETGSRMDDIIFEEFKGTGNMELHLDRKLSDRRVFPAIDLLKSGTRREELLLSEDEMNGEYQVRRMLNGRQQEMYEQLVDLMTKTNSNAEFFDKLKGWLAAMEKGGYSNGNR